MKNFPNWVMLGTGNKDGEAHHGLLVGYNKKFSNYGMTIYYLKKPVTPFEDFEDDNVRSEAFNICFCNKENLTAMIEQLKSLKEFWDANDEKRAVQEADVTDIYRDHIEQA